MISCRPSCRIGVALTLISLTSCSTPSTAPSPPHRGGTASANLSGRDSADLQEIQTLYTKGLHEQVIARADAIERKRPKSAVIAQTRNFKGMSYLLTRRYSQAAAAFKKSLDASNQAGFRQYVLYNLASAQFDANQNEEARATLSQVKFDLLDRETRFKFFGLRSRTALKANLPLDSARDLILLASLVDESAARAGIVVQLDQALQSTTDLPGVEKLLEGQENSQIADSLHLRVAQLQAQTGKIAEAGSRIQLLLEKFPNSRKAPEARELLASLSSATKGPVNPANIGVLLPLKGKFARFGQRTLQALQLSFGIFNSDRPDSRITLVIEDSGEDAESTIKALNTLVQKHQVIGVVGPLLSKGIDQVAARAQELGVPLLSLSQQPSSSDFMIPAALTPQSQAVEVARHAIEVQGLKRFAILHPRDKFGEQYAMAFWEAVERFGGEITGIESYTPNDTDFRIPVDKLSGLFYQDARSRELADLAKVREEQQIKKRTRKTEQFFALKPIVDYDAVFIPDEPKVVGQILPTFAYRDVKNIRFLGVATWHSPDLVQRAQSHAEGAIFVDAFFPEGGDRAAANFLNLYRSTYNQDPGAMEALAYDAGDVLQDALNRSARTRSELRDRLRETRGFAGVTGRISFTEGQLQRTLAVLTIRSGKTLQSGVPATGKPGDRSSATP